MKSKYLSSLAFAPILSSFYFYKISKGNKIFWEMEVWIMGQSQILWLQIHATEFSHYLLRQNRIPFLKSYFHTTTFIYLPSY